MQASQDIDDLLRVNVGCGQSPTSGWLNFDSSPSVLLAQIPGLLSLLKWVDGCSASSDHLGFARYAREHRVAFGDITKGLPIKSNSCSVVYASHVIEHLAAREVRLFLREAARILAPGGILRLAVPDLRIYIHAYLADSDADQFIKKLNFFPSRGRSRLGRFLFAFAGDRTLHRWCYDQESLERILTNAGFVQPVRLPPGETTISNPGALNLRERAWESLYMEAVKPSRPCGSEILMSNEP